MLAPLSWLKDYVEIDVSAKELEEKEQQYYGTNNYKLKRRNPKDFHHNSPNGRISHAKRISHALKRIFHAR